MKKLLIFSSVAFIFLNGCVQENATPQPIQSITKPSTVKKQTIPNEDTICDQCQEEKEETQVEKRSTSCPHATKVIHYVSNCNNKSCGFPVTVRNTTHCNKGDM